MLDAVSKLGKKHFYKTEPCQIVRGIMVDYYKVRGLKGEDVYIHLYVDPEKDVLVVQSCKRLV